MAYRKVKYPCTCDVFRFPNAPSSGIIFSLVKARISWYPKFGAMGGVNVGAGDPPIVIIAFPSDVILVGSSDPAVGGDLLRIQGGDGSVYQILEFAEHMSGFPNMTHLATARKGIDWPVGPP